MALLSNNNLNKTRYTHRDYNSIKEDLINAIPSLTQEWTSREESDPGIVLIKLMSMFGDTLSYNVDKIALELYIQTVSQRKNCAKILELLGYKMHWYISGRVMAHVRLLVSQDEEGNPDRVVLSPYKTTFVAGKTRYTVTNQGKGSGDIDIWSDQTAVPVMLIEGTPVVQSFTKDDLINNRYYFNSSNIDETEILLTISNISSTQISCKLVDNLYLVSSSSIIYYEFNIDEYDRPYIELAEGWEDIAGSDTAEFSITYILSSGSLGNISNNAFTNVYDASGTGSVRNLVISNLSNITKYGTSYQSENNIETYNSPGKDPQTVDDARKESSNYVFTHDTLVTSSDFEKACKREQGITVSKLVDAQVIINDLLNLDDVCNRALDKFPKIEVQEESLEDPETIETHEYLAAYQVIMYLAYHNFDPEWNYYYSSPKVQNTVWSLQSSTNSDPYNRIFWNPIETYTGDGVSHNFTINQPYTDLSVVNIDGVPTNKYNYDKSSGVISFTTPPKSGSIITIHKSYGAESPGYYPYKVNNNILLSVRELLKKLQMLNVKVDFGTMKLFPFKVKGTLHLVEPISPDETLQVVRIVDNALHEAYYPDQHPVGEKPNFIELVDIIQNSDIKIKYFDAIGNIVEWAPEVQTRIQDMDKIFDTTSAIMYNGLSSEFNLSKRFLKYRFKNVEVNLDAEEQNNIIEGTEGLFYIPNDYGTAYLLNYSKVANLSYIKRVQPNTSITLQLENIQELDALCTDLKFKGQADIRYKRTILSTSDLKGETSPSPTLEYTTSTETIDSNSIINSITHSGKLYSIQVNSEEEYLIDDQSSALDESVLAYINSYLSITSIQLSLKFINDTPSTSYEYTINISNYSDKVDDGSPLDDHESYIYKYTLINNTGMQWIEEL